MRHLGRPDYPRLHQRFLRFLAETFIEASKNNQFELRLRKFLRFLAETFIEASIVNVLSTGVRLFLRFLAETFIEAPTSTHTPTPPN